MRRTLKKKFHMLHSIASIILHVADAWGRWREGAELRVGHFTSSTSDTRPEVWQDKAVVEEHLNASRWDWQRYVTLLMKMNKGISKCQTPHLKKVSSISQWNQRISLYNTEWLLSGRKKWMHRCWECPSTIGIPCTEVTQLARCWCR